MLRSLVKSLLARPRQRVGETPSRGIEDEIREGLAAEVRDPERAERHYRAALAVAPRNVDALLLLGSFLVRAARHEEALPFFERAFETDPSCAEAAYQMWMALDALDRHDQSMQWLHRAIECRPGFAPAHSALGNVHKKLGEPEKARRHYLIALEADPSLHAVWHNLAAVERDLGQSERAIEHFDRAVGIAPDALESRFSRALALLETGDLERGWQQYEVRWQLPRHAPNPRRFELPAWDGSVVAEGALLVWGEQGIGDELLFSTMYPDLLARTPDVIFECSPKLAPLFRRSFAPAQVVARRQPPARQCARAVRQVPAGSLAKWLRPSLEDFPEQGARLRVDGNRAAEFRASLEALGPGLRIGFCWRSNDVRGERALSCTTLDAWADVLAMPGIHWICLQYDRCEEELQAARDRYGVKLHRLDGLDYFDDLDGVAALMSTLDLVISAPTTVSVLSALVGVETWQYQYGADWQTHGTGRNPWLPALHRFPRAAGEGWEPVFRRIKRALQIRLDGAA